MRPNGFQPLPIPDRFIFHGYTRKDESTIPIAYNATNSLAGSAGPRPVDLPPEVYQTPMALSSALNHQLLQFLQIDYLNVLLKSRTVTVKSCNHKAVVRLRSIE